MSRNYLDYAVASSLSPLEKRLFFTSRIAPRLEVDSWLSWRDAIFEGEDVRFVPIEMRGSSARLRWTPVDKRIVVILFRRVFIDEEVARDFAARTRDAGSAERHERALARTRRSHRRGVPTPLSRRYVLDFPLLDFEMRIVRDPVRGSEVRFDGDGKRRIRTIHERTREAIRRDEMPWYFRHMIEPLIDAAILPATMRATHDRPWRRFNTVFSVGGKTVLALMIPHEVGESVVFKHARVSSFARDVGAHGIIVIGIVFRRVYDSDPSPDEIDAWRSAIPARERVVMSKHEWTPRYPPPPSIEIEGYVVGIETSDSAAVRWREGGYPRGCRFGGAEMLRSTLENAPRFEGREEPAEW